MIGEYKAEIFGQQDGPNERRWEFLCYGLFFGLGLVILATFLNYDLTCDEEFGKTYGQYILRWYSTFFKDQSALGYYNLHLYGGFFEAISQLTASITENVLPIGVYELRHLINALFGFLGILAAYKLGTHVLGPKAGFFSALFLVVTPGFYGQMFNDSKTFHSRRSSRLRSIIYSELTTDSPEFPTVWL
jgi:hypothetical protein